ncbi:GAF domain-containing protein [Litorilituus sediminis]|uniref:GAF domain-containing protein n=1 Tax=Litorilituus sediminis TaxID=718192 RepID=A0A4P6P2W3_9GAMM|nr:GAF domain-containing protein [Litorilituus sediminis]QBG35593.1 GAF domain-containing protein [Litorilituus sediminis]
MEEKYQDKLKSFMAKAKFNNKYSDKIVGRTLLFSNIWATLLAPILIGIGISHIYNLPENVLPNALFWILLTVFLLIHLATAYLVHQNNSKYSLYSQAVELEESHSNELTNTRDELAKYIHAFKKVAHLHSNQMSTLYLTACITDEGVGEINQVEDGTLTIKEFMDKAKEPIRAIIRTLCLEREALFGYRSQSLYNIALYMYNHEEDHLFMIERDCDSRLPQRNRDWKPGHGHVGLAFLHKQTKISGDITKSDELATNNTTESDKNNYKSFISLPILSCEDDGDVNNEIKPLGVLVLTSADESQFEQDRDLQFLTTISKFLAIYLASIESHYSHNNFKANDEIQEGVKDE